MTVLNRVSDRSRDDGNWENSQYQKDTTSYLSRYPSVPAGNPRDEDHVTDLQTQ